MWWIELELVKGIKFSINYFHIPSKVMHIQILVVIEYIGKVIPRLGNTSVEQSEVLSKKLDELEISYQVSAVVLSDLNVDGLQIAEKGRFCF